MTKHELLAILDAYRRVIAVAAPGLHLDTRAASHTSDAVELEAELARRLAEASSPSCRVRLFFKLGHDLRYGGCNAQFAADAGLARPEDIVGLDDFDPRIAWVAQAAKYRRDDRAVLESGEAKLGIIERQSSASGVILLDTSKVPILDGRLSLGVFGAYEIIDGKTAAQRSSERNH